MTVYICPFYVRQNTSVLFNLHSNYQLLIRCAIKVFSDSLFRVNMVTECKIASLKTFVANSIRSYIKLVFNVP